VLACIPTRRAATLITKTASSARRNLERMLTGESIESYTLRGNPGDFTPS
jgi:hypothetical protein